MANSFKKYFSSVGSLTALKAGQLAKDQNWTLDSNAYETSNVSTLGEQFEFQPVSENNVANIILNLPSNKAPGFDNVPARILKDSLPATLQIITSLMEGDIGVCGISQFFKRYFGNFNFKLRYCGVLRICGMRYFWRFGQRYLIKKKLLYAVSDPSLV